MDVGRLRAVLRQREGLEGNAGVSRAVVLARRVVTVKELDSLLCPTLSGLASPRSLGIRDATHFGHLEQVAVSYQIGNERRADAAKQERLQCELLSLTATHVRVRGVKIISMPQTVAFGVSLHGSVHSFSVSRPEVW